MELQQISEIAMKHFDKIKNSINDAEALVHLGRAIEEGIRKAKIIGEANAQASVSGNEANPSENKKDGEVALPEKLGTNCRECTALLEDDNIYGLCADCYFSGNDR